MNRTVMAALLIVLLPALVVAHPGIGGGRGLLRVQNALVEDEAGLTLSLHALGRRPFYTDWTGGVPVPNMRAWVVDVVAPELSYAPIVTKYVGLELFGSYGAILQSPKSERWSGIWFGLHDLKAGGKLSIPVLPVLKLGGTGTYTFLKRDTTGHTPFDPRQLPYPEKKFAWKALATLQLQDVLPSAPNFIFNYGKTNDWTDYGVGLQLAGKSFGIFVEGVSQQSPASTGILDMDNGHVHVTPGLVLGSPTKISLTAAYTFTLHKETGTRTEANEAVLGISIPTSFGAHAKPVYGTVAGTITDFRSTAPVNAMLALPGIKAKQYKDKLIEVGDNGAFKLDKLPVGSVVIEVSKEGYHNATATVVVEKDQVTVQDFQLRSLKQAGTITGAITDAKTGAPIGATVQFPGTDIAEVATDPAIGVFTAADVPVGVVTVNVSAEGYQSSSAPVTVKDGEVTTRNFALRSMNVFGSITGRVIDASTRNPIAATISFPDSMAMAAVSSDAGTGVYSTGNIPVGTMTITASAAGYLQESRPVVVEDGKVANVEFALRPAQEFGSISGAVTDATTGKPVAAQVTSSDPTMPAVTADPASGFYKLDKVAVGVMVIKAAADGYFPAQMTVTVEANKAATQNFALSPAAQDGQLSGVVTDLNTKAPLGATVSFPGTGVPSVQSDPATGLYKATVPVGPLVVACALDGYVTQMSPTPVVIQSNVPAVYNFQMLKIGTEITLSNDAIHFAFNSAEIQSAGYPALDEWVKLMKDNPFMTAEIQGHTDAVGSESYNQALSERRAASVVNYLTGRGVERSRLTAIGYGESRLVEQTQEKSEANRRVIFKVTGEKK